MAQAHLPAVWAPAGWRSAFKHGQTVKAGLPACGPAWVCLAGAALLLNCCVRYVPLGLPTRAHLAAGPGELAGGGAAGRRLTVADVADLDLRNNPDLLAARRQRGVAQSQLLAAGILPNPILAAQLQPLAAGVPGTAAVPATPQAAAMPAQSVTPAYSIALSYDIRSLLTLHQRRAAARDAALQVDGQLLWQEWQSAGQARLLAVDLITGAHTLGLLERTRDILDQRVQLTQRATAAGNATLATLAPDIAALSTAQTAVHDGQRLMLARRHQLNAMLGLLPDAELDLAETPDLPRVNSAEVLRDLASLPQRRPDLAALRFGYQSQDHRLRAAILGQFPNFSVGVVGGSDNANVRSIGPQISVDLPVFDRNQGNIAIEGATRLQLRDEYAARLNAADGQVRALLSEIALIAQQLAQARPLLAPVRRMETVAARALRDGSIDERSQVDFVVARLNREVEIAALEQLLVEQEVGLEVLTGAGLAPLDVSVQ